MDRDEAQKLRDRIKKLMKPVQKVASNIFKNVALSAAITLFPTNTATSSGNTNRDKQQDEISLTINNTEHLLALAMPNDANACTQSLAYASVATESLGTNPKNPATVVSKPDKRGIRYYGQHQFGSTYHSDFMVKKYIAYALINGSEEFVKELKSNLMVGSEANKNKLIQKFMSSFEEYDQQGKPEKAFSNSNPAYKALAAGITFSPSTFKKAHEKFPEEAYLQQKMCVLDIYMHMIGTPIQEIMEKHPEVDFVQINPAVWGSVIAIAVKQGNGGRFNKALNNISPKFADRDFCNEMQTELRAKHEALGNEGEVPLAVSFRKGNISPEDIVLQKINGKTTLVVYDKNKQVTMDDIAVAKDLIIKTKKGKEKLTNFDLVIQNTSRPQGIKSLRPITLYDRSDADVTPVQCLNTDSWLEDYCGSQFAKVYEAAKKDIHKVPTPASYEEISILLRKPELMEMIGKILNRKNLEEDLQMIVENPSEQNSSSKKTVVAQNTGKAQFDTSQLYYSKKNNHTHG